MKKLTIAVSAAILLALAGCDNKDSATSAATSGGNFTAKVETLSSANSDDIKSDLTALNAVINTSNSESLKLREDLAKVTSSGDMSAIKDVMKKSMELLESTNTKLTALTLKSQEVQSLRVDIVNGNMKAMKMSDLATKQPLSADDQKELIQLGKESVALQMSTGAKLNELNSKYAVK